MLHRLNESKVIQIVCEVGGYVDIRTLEGVMRADPGDWIIRGVRGELYVCKPDIFAETYEPVANDGTER